MTVVSPRVLLISESRITRRVVEMTFADQQVDLVTAATGQDGLAAWDDRPAAVVLADLTMDAPPDGLAVARHVQAHGGDRPVAVLLMAGQHDVGGRRRDRRGRRARRHPQAARLAAAHRRRARRPARRPRRAGPVGAGGCAAATAVDAGLDVEAAPLDAPLPAAAEAPAVAVTRRGGPRHARSRDRRSARPS